MASRLLNSKKDKGAGATPGKVYLYSQIFKAITTAQLTAAMMRPSTRKGTTYTDLSFTVITRSIPSNMLYFYRNSQPSPKINGETVPRNIMSPSLCQKRLRIDGSTPSSLQLCHSSQTDQVASGYANICKGHRIQPPKASISIPPPPPRSIKHILLGCGQGSAFRGIFTPEMFTLRIKRAWQVSKVR